MGHGAAFAWRGPADIFREHAALSGTDNPGTRLFDISALSTLTDSAYATMPPVRWPRPAKYIARSRLFADGRFPTQTGRAALVPTPPRGPAHAPGALYPLVLITGRIRDQWHTMTRTGRAPRLFRHIGEPFLSVHPEDTDLPDNSLVRIESAWGTGILRLRHDYGMRRGTVFAPMHWTAAFCAAGRINAAVNPATDLISGQPEFKHTPVRLAQAAMDWHAFALTRREFAPAAPFTAKIPLDGPVWRYELAGTGPAAGAHAALLDALGGAAPWMALRDPTAAVYRAAQIADGQLQACLFTGPDHALPSRDWLISLFAQPALAAADRRALLAARRPGGAAPEPPICVCMGVGAGAIRAAITGGCRDVAAVGAATKAGTNCGSCKPEIAGILAAMRVPEPA